MAPPKLLNNYRNSHIYSYICIHTYIFIYICVYIYIYKFHRYFKSGVSWYFSFFCVCEMGLDSGLHTCKAGILSLEPHLQYILLMLFWIWGLTKYFPGWPGPMILPISVTHVARITGLSHQCQALLISFSYNSLLAQETLLIFVHYIVSRKFAEFILLILLEYLRFSVY
jgi:hypothetical protein